MAINTLPQLTNEININKQVLLTMLLAGTSATEDKSLKGALTRARKAVLAGRAFRFDGTTLEVQSMSRSWQFHSCTLESCDCEAFTNKLICWHRALIGVLVALQTLQASMLVVAEARPVVAPAPEPAGEITVEDGYMRDEFGDIIGFAIGTKKRYTAEEYAELYA